MNAMQNLTKEKQLKTRRTSNTTFENDQLTKMSLC